MNKIAKILAVFLLVLYLNSLRFVVQTVSADACEDECKSGTVQQQQSCLATKKICLENKLSGIQKEKQSLNSIISTLNTEINIQEVKIRQKNQEIAELEKELIDLSQRLDGLNVSLEKMTTLLITRVREQYKQQRNTNRLELLASGSLSEFIKGYKYTELSGSKTADSLEKTENQRIIYDNQKALKETKQTEIEEAKKALQKEQNIILNQRKEKQKVLDLTNNDEKKFQQLLKEAEAQVASLGQYTQSRGGAGLLSGKTQCDDWGCYYNQRDSQWGTQLIGKSSQNLANVGCLVTAAAMVASHYGKNITPADIARSWNPFSFNTADMMFTWYADGVNGVKVSRSRICGGNSCALSALDGELNAGRPAIIRINASNSVGTHFLVITKKENGQYIMKDPYEADGNNIPFTSKHSLSQITAVDRVSVQ